jgi:zinc transport system permease protein
MSALLTLAFWQQWLDPEFLLPFVQTFWQPFLAGLAFAILLPILGCYLRLRGEWLAALAYAQIAAAGALVTMALELPLLIGGGAAALLAALGKRLGGLGSHTPQQQQAQQAAAYPILLVLGWGISVLLVNNLPMAERLGHALFDGQLYLTEASHLAIGSLWAILALLLLKGLSRRILLAQVYPDYFRASGQAQWPTQLGFDLLTAASLALATLMLGVMAAFALIFIPPWLAFRHAQSWQRGLWQALAISVGSYLFSFLIALPLDQPFGPVLAVVLVGVSGIMLINPKAK